ncbi:hypothetical protein IAT40_007470 [Kwoniella sp. CBS 6097]
MPPRIPLRSLTSVSATRSLSSSLPRFIPSAPGPSSKAGPSTPTPPARKGIEKRTGDEKPKRQPVGPGPLPRPLGIKAVPTAKAKSWNQLKQELMDDERHREKRKALVKEATQGYFHDYNRAKVAGGGKLWIAPNVLIKDERALHFPNIEGRSLLGKDTHTTDLLRGKTTIVSIITTRLSEEHEQSFVQPVLEDVAGHPDFNFLQINHQDNKLKSMLISFLTSSLKRTVPEERWGSYLLARGEWPERDLKQPLGIENKLLGYIYLVDPNLKIRWAGCGQATREEAQALRRATAVLLGRMKGVHVPLNKGHGEGGETKEQKSS